MKNVIYARPREKLKNELQVRGKFSYIVNLLSNSSIAAAILK